MNYRHAYHAGNHGDVLKHTVLARILTYMVAKDKPFRLLDTHAGVGRYDLAGPEAFKTGEWREGIGQLLDAPLGQNEEHLFAPYLSIVKSANPGGQVRNYCGSPEIAARLLRPRDRMVFNELHPQDRTVLAVNYANDRRIRVTGVDAIQSVKSELPFPERRGIVLIDPAYESPDDTDDLARMMTHCIRRMAQTIVLAWYPIKSEGFAANLLAKVREAGVAQALHIRLMVEEAHEHGGLAGSGLLVVNAPWILKDECAVILPALVRILGKGKWGRGTVEWLAPAHP